MNVLVKTKRVAVVLFSTLVITALPAPALAQTGAKFPKGTFLIKTPGNNCAQFVPAVNPTFELLPCSKTYKASQVWQLTDGSVRLAGQLRNVGSGTKCAYAGGDIGPVTCLAKGEKADPSYVSTLTSIKSIKTVGTRDGKMRTVCWSQGLGVADCATGKNEDGKVTGVFRFTFPKPPAR